MTGGSLGQRTSSYGSLQQQQQLQNSVALLPIQTTPVPRKQGKMLLSGSREKERFLPRICKFAGRRRVGMLLLVVVSVVVFMSVLSAVNKACPVCYLPVEQAIASMPSVPSSSPVQNLTYVYEEKPISTEPFPSGGSEFGGFPSLQQRTDSFEIKESMNVHCGFVRGTQPGRQTGFDMDDADLREMEQCRGVVVASAIFGNYDVLQQPKNMSETTKKDVCFYMFVDQETEAYMKIQVSWMAKIRLAYGELLSYIIFLTLMQEGTEKVPKLLLHRIFPNVRYSLWVDGKLELVVDPYQLLERFLWRKNASFAISRHYRRFDVFMEAEANKAAGKYDNASIDFQVEFYRREGLTHYSEAKLPITSVDRFTSRDQISFSTVRDKIMSKVDWGVNMFLDCERRTFTLLHRLPLLFILHHYLSPPPPLPLPPPLDKTNDLSSSIPSPDTVTEADRRSGSRRRNPKTATQ
ncbi:hypothetical protein MKW92_008283 [Papaver armeniacum]|nr:hypothetical protein MKW92_008283 [Papaver armeniacum]